MLGELFNNPIAFALGLIALVVAITIHEFAHAYAADQLGDPTPRLQGRLTLNPLAHLDPLGSLMLLIAKFGWGKPVVFDPYNLRHPRRDAAIISLAGPAINIVFAAILSVLLRVLLTTPLAMAAYTLLPQFIVINVFLAIFNLVPVHPLDGFKIVGGLLSEKTAKEWYALEPYGMVLLFLLVFPLFGGIAPIQAVIMPIIRVILTVFLPGSGTSGVI